MAHASKKTTLPQWYHRLVALGKRRPIKSYDFDEDLSDLEEVLDDDGDSNFEDVDDDNLSEMSYNGSDADEYYELKDRREDRKREIWEFAQEDRESKARTIEDERQIGVEGQKTKERLQHALQQGQQPPEISIVNKKWNLYSAEYVEYCWDLAKGLFRQPYVSFTTLDLGRYDNPGPDDDVSCHVWLEEESCYFPNFSPPRRASLEPMVLRGRFDIELQFISNKYIIIKIPREFVFLNFGPPPPSAPAIFMFTGKRFPRGLV
ncbi:hypothetical protein NM208_g9471 [Fusarium decemcellulare]|uniref:Uncharacterized protein n=1 Tax=Fusarium decemcellulare TaxID=57161 RepID=A0ACC1S1F5_9HYPO|nr:hypothetical protein NM208_g9471 [Fusarium decemcellulare]